MRDVTRIRITTCWLWHHWTAWKDKAEAIESYHFGGGCPVLIQERRCEHCNAAERRLVRV